MPNEGNSIQVWLVETEGFDQSEAAVRILSYSVRPLEIISYSSKAPPQNESSDLSRWQVILFLWLGQEDSAKYYQLKKLLHTHQNTSIIVVAEHFHATLDERLMKLGVDDCLPLQEISHHLLFRTIRHAIQRKADRNKLAFLSTHDQLTGLPNRYLFQQHLEHAIGMAKRTSQCFAVMFLDLDKFKLINDSLGHDYGDLLLISIADRLLHCVRETDIVARFGNDEFAILLENFGSSHHLSMIAEKIQHVIEPAFNIKSQELFITSSIGIATFPDCGIESESILKCADSALYRAKSLGRNQHYFFTGDLNKQAKLKLELEKDLRRALINGEFEIHLQPQINPKDESVAGAEALLRWQHPKLGWISPSVFVPILDDLGLLPGVEAWVLNQVCTLAKRLTDRYGQLRFSVNISGSHFKLGNLKEHVYLALQASSLDANFLEVELTEDIMIEHVERNHNILNELKELGISIALDDFGKGYSSLSYLKHFPANILKIDKAFIDHLVEDKKDSAIVESLIQLAHRLDLKVVAEGVEKNNQRALLEKIGCDYIQGYFYCKPISITHFEQFIKTRSEEKNRQHTHSLSAD